jgi:hypothetical protein
VKGPRARAAEAAELAATVRAGLRAHGGNPVSMTLRARRVRRRQGFEYGEALRAGLLDPRMGRRDRAGHTSRHRTLEVQRRVNPEALGPLTGDKGIFYRYCAARGIPIPQLYAIVGRGLGWRRGDRPLCDAGDLAALLGESLPDDLVVKPTEGYHGRGVRLLRRDRVDATRLYAELTSDPEFDAFVVQERLRDHPDLAALVPGETLQTVRIVTLAEPSGDVAVLTADLRVAVAGAATDNFRSGRTGNGLAEVSLEDGTLGPVMLPRPDGCGFVRSPTVPGTGARVQGVRLPHWRETLDAVREAAPHLLPARTFGWDVAVTATGPVIVEANMFWWPRTSPHQAEVLARIEGR